jgi:hypothetical protein
MLSISNANNNANTAIPITTPHTTPHTTPQHYTTHYTTLHHTLHHTTPHYTTLHYTTPHPTAGVRPAVVGGAQGARLLARLLRQPAVSMGVPHHEQGKLRIIFSSSSSSSY